MMETEIEIAACPVGKSGAPGNLLFLAFSIVRSCLQSAFVGLQIRVADHYGQMFDFVLFSHNCMFYVVDLTVCFNITE